MISGIIKYFFGTANERAVKKLRPVVEKINAFEDSIASLSDEALRDKTDEFKSRYQRGESLNSLLPEAFAVVREASARTLGMRHYDVQLIGGMVLHQGTIAEMKTGEGKTLVATLPLYLNSLTGKGVHLVTVNDYLAKRDSEWMAPIYTFLGLTVSALQNDMDDEERKKAYKADILYGTNSEFGFDYLRDNMKFRLGDYVQRDLHYAIVDEVDSILIDEARTPLIISGPAEEDSEIYQKANQLVKSFKHNVDYEFDIKDRNALLTEIGVDKAENFFEIKNLYSVDNIKVLHHLNQILKAYVVFKKDVDYVVVDGEVLIVDEFTGRIMAGRRYSDGLHQAIEAKEGLEIQRESQTLASITLQNYFRMYDKLAGMTGTAATEAEEFHKIYSLDVISIPTNKNIQRMDKPDLVFLTEQTKFDHIVTDVRERHKKGQPILIGTVAIETSERLSHELKKHNIPHEVLNAKQHEREADIVAHAGERGRITIATNMAGRGTDIKLTTESLDAGGLYILGTERHESRRIDNQLRGRSGRQGDVGESRFYISLDDSLIKRFGGDSIKVWMQRSGMKEDEVIEDSMVSNTIETAQEKIEKQNFEVRKHLIEYDDVLNQQRKVIYNLRRIVLEGGDNLISVVKNFIIRYIEAVLAPMINKSFESENEFKELLTKLDNVFGENISLKIKYSKNVSFVQEQLIDVLIALYEDSFNVISIVEVEQEKNSEEAMSSDEKRDRTLNAQKWFLLEVIDDAWRQHIVNLEHIREGIGLRGYGQKTPIIEYKKESYALFKTMMESMIELVLSRILKINIASINEGAIEKRRMKELKQVADALQAKNSEGEGSSPDVLKKMFQDFTFNNSKIKKPKNKK